MLSTIARNLTSASFSYYQNTSIYYLSINIEWTQQWHTFTDSVQGTMLEGRWSSWGELQEKHFKHCAMLCGALMDPIPHFLSEAVKSQRFSRSWMDTTNHKVTSIENDKLTHYQGMFFLNTPKACLHSDAEYSWIKWGHSRHWSKLKVPISRLGILHIRNFWVFLSKMIYLLSRKFHIRGVFRRQSWLFQGFLNYGREKKKW